MPDITCLFWLENLLDRYLINDLLNYTNIKSCEEDETTIGVLVHVHLLRYFIQLNVCVHNGV